MMAGVEGQSLEWESGISDDVMHGFLLSSSKGLAELTRDRTARVQFIHESVREFLLTEGGLKHIEHDRRPTSAGQDHELLKLCCLRGIQEEAGTCRREMGLTDWQDNPKSPATAWKPSASKALREKVTQRFPFLDYATNFMLYHSDQAARYVSQYEFLVNLDLIDWVDKANFLQKHGVNLYNKPLDLVYLCAERNHASLIWTLASHKHNFQQTHNQRCYCPLFAALAYKSKDAARVILEQEGAIDPDEILQDIIVHNHKGRHAYGRDSAVERTYWTTWQARRLFLAMMHHHESLAVHLLRISDFDEFHYFDQRDFLWHGIEKGLEKVVAILLARGVNINSWKQFGRSGLSEVTTRRENLQGMLLAKGANVDVPQPRPNDSTLLLAVEQSNTKMVELLLAEGVDIAVRSANYDSPLLVAIEQGSKEMVQVLLTGGVDVNAQGGWYGSPLLAAVHGGNQEIVELLLVSGADVDAHEGWYSSLLLAAVNWGSKQMVEMLLGGGTTSSVTVDNEWYAHLLLVAETRGNTDVVEALLAGRAQPKGEEETLVSGT